jgi:peptide/nickel transport system permease protein
MVGRSLRQIVWARLRRDRLAMLTVVILVVYYLIGIVGPIVGPLLGLDPYAFDRAAISNSGGRPILLNGGISEHRSAGVGTGRDILSQLP